MTSMSESGGAPLPSLPTANVQLSSHDVVTSPLGIDSATAHLLTEATSVLWRTFDYFARDGILMMTRIYARAVAGIKVLSLSLASPPLLLSANAALRMIASGNSRGDHAHDDDDDDDAARGGDDVDGADDAPHDVDATSITSHSSMASSRERNIVEFINHGLAFDTSDIDDAPPGGGSQRLDYVITQLDVSRMARVDTRDMRHHAAGVRRPPGAFSADTSLILSSHEGGEQDVDAILQRCAPVIEVYFESNLDNVDTDRLGHGIDDDDPCQFSWMMVSSDVKEDGMTRMSASDIIGDVPVSISICKTNDFVNLECNNTNTLDYCVACKNLFQDGDSLHILPCQHLYHRGCIDTWQAGGFSRNESSICPLCDKAQEKTSSQQEDYEDKRVKASSWGLVRLGSLLSS